MSLSDYAFGRRTTLPTTQRPSEDDLRFSFELHHKSSSSSLPYWQQGDEELDSETNLLLRRALRSDPSVTAELHRFWAVYANDSAGRVSKTEYLNVHAKLSAVLIPDLTHEEVVAAGEEDWESDSKGKEKIGEEEVCDCLFELADLWCSSIDAAEYASFLRKLFKRVTVKYVRSKDGRVLTSQPSKPVKHKLEAYRSFRESRRRASGGGGLASTMPVLGRRASIAEPDYKDGVFSVRRPERPLHAEHDGVGEGATDMEAPAEGGGEDRAEATVEGAEVGLREGEEGADAGADGPANEEEEEEEEVDGSDDKITEPAEGETVTYGWAAEEHLFPLVLYSEGPLDFRQFESGGEEEDIDEAGRRAAPAPAPPAPTDTSTAEAAARSRLSFSARMPLSRRGSYKLTPRAAEVAAEVRVEVDVAPEAGPGGEPKADAEARHEAIGEQAVEDSDEAASSARADVVALPAMPETTAAIAEVKGVAPPAEAEGATPPSDARGAAPMEQAEGVTLPTEAASPQTEAERPAPAEAAPEPPQRRVSYEELAAQVAVEVSVHEREAIEGAAKRPSIVRALPPDLLRRSQRASLKNLIQISHADAKPGAGALAALHAPEAASGDASAVAAARRGPTSASAPFTEKPNPIYPPLPSLAPPTDAPTDLYWNLAADAAPLDAEALLTPEVLEASTAAAVAAAYSTAPKLLASVLHAGEATDARAAAAAKALAEALAEALDLPLVDGANATDGACSVSTAGLVRALNDVGAAAAGGVVLGVNAAEAAAVIKNDTGAALSPKSVFITCGGAPAPAASTGTAILHGGLPLSQLVDAALNALGQPLPRPRAVHVPLPEEALSEGTSLEDQIAALCAAPLPARFYSPPPLPPPLDDEDTPAPEADGQPPLPPLALGAYGTFCPVKLAMGELVPGSTRHAVVIGRKLYLASDDEALAMLTSTAFALDPAPSLPASSRLAILGPPASGRPATAVAAAAALGDSNTLLLSRTSLPALLDQTGSRDCRRLARMISAAPELVPPALLTACVAALEGGGAHTHLEGGSGGASVLAALLASASADPAPAKSSLDALAEQADLDGSELARALRSDGGFARQAALSGALRALGRAIGAEGVDSGAKTGSNPLEPADFYALAVCLSTGAAHARSLAMRCFGAAATGVDETKAGEVEVPNAADRVEGEADAGGTDVGVAFNTVAGVPAVPGVAAAAALRATLEASTQLSGSLMDEPNGPEHAEGLAVLIDELGQRAAGSPVDWREFVALCGLLLGPSGGSPASVSLLGALSIAGKKAGGNGAAGTLPATELAATIRAASVDELEPLAAALDEAASSSTPSMTRTEVLRLAAFFPSASVHGDCNKAAAAAQVLEALSPFKSGGGNMAAAEAIPTDGVDTVAAAEFLRKMKPAVSRAERLALAPPPRVVGQDLAAGSTSTEATEGLRRRSIVFSGLPVTAEQFRALSDAGFAPSRALLIVDGSGARATREKLEAGEQVLSDDGDVPLTAATLDAAIELYAAEIPALTEAMEASHVTVIRVDAARAMASPSGAAGMIDPFTPKAAATPLDAEDGISALPASGDGALGATGIFCPVKLTRDGLLCRGKAQYAAKVGSKTFVCAGEAELEDLLLNPRLAPLGTAPPLPPPLLLISGTPGSGAKQQASMLAENRALPLLDVEALLQRNPPPPPEREEGEESEVAGSDLKVPSDPLSRSSNDIASLLHSALSGPPYNDGTGGVLLWPNTVPLDEAMVAALTQVKALPQAAVFLQLSDDEAVARNFVPAERPLATAARRLLKEERQAALFSEAREKVAAVLEEEPMACMQGIDALVEEITEAGNDPAPMRELAHAVRAAIASNSENTEDLPQSTSVSPPPHLVAAAATALAGVAELPTPEDAVAWWEEKMAELDSADDEQRGALAEANATGTARIEEAEAALMAAGVSTHVLAAAHKPMHLQREARAAVAPFTSGRESLLCGAAHPLAPADAAELLGAGEVALSRFGSHDPVAVTEKGSSAPPLAPWRSDRVKADSPLESSAQSVDEAPVKAMDEGEGEGEESEEQVQARATAAAAEADRVAAQEALTIAAPEPHWCVRYGECVFFFGSEESRDAFVEAPGRYAAAPPPPLHVPPRACVLASPTEERRGSQLAARLAERLSAIYVSTLGAVRFAAAADDSLAQRVAAAGSLEAAAADNALAAAALSLRLSAADALRRGWVLDGAPSSRELATALEDVGLRPHRVFLLAGASEDACAPWADRQLSEHLPSTSNEWAIFDAMERSMRSQLVLRSRHAAAIAAGRAAAIGTLGVTGAEVRARLAPPPLGGLCAVTWARERVLLPVDVEGGHSPPHVAEYRGRTYVFGTATKLAAFLLRPAEVLAACEVPPPPSPAEPLNPGELPSARGGVVPPIASWASLGGFCPVALATGVRDRYLRPSVQAHVPGSTEHCVRYEGQIFACADADALRRFCAEPWRYSRQSLAAKRPLILAIGHASKATSPDAEIHTLFSTLPLHGYMEQALGEPLKRALAALAELRPKHPCLSRKQTATKFVALHLQAHNPRTRLPHRKHRAGAALQIFREACDLLDALVARASVASNADTVDINDNAGGNEDIAEDQDELLVLWDQTIEAGVQPVSP